jgi:hypothetical protein
VIFIVWLGSREESGMLVGFLGLVVKIEKARTVLGGIHEQLKSTVTFNGLEHSKLRLLRGPTQRINLALSVCPGNCPRSLTFTTYTSTE